MTRQAKLWASLAVLAVLLILLGLPFPEARAEPVSHPVSVDLFGQSPGRTIITSIPAPARAVTGTATVTLTGWDLDEAGEGAITVGGCDAVPFPAAYQPQDGLDGQAVISVPVICFAKQPGLEGAPVCVDHVSSSGFRLSGIAYEIPEQPVFESPPQLLTPTIEQLLSRAGVLPPGWVTAQARAVKTKQGTRLITTLCLTSTAGERHAVSFWRSQMVAWLDGGPPAIPRAVDRVACGW